MKTLNFLILVLAFVIMTSAGSYSQNDTSRSREKLKKVVKEKLIEKLKIDESTANKLIEMSAAHKKEMKELNMKRKDLAEYVFENAQSSDIGTKLEDLMDTENKINQLRNDHYAKLKTFLTPTQIAQSMVFQKNLMKWMQKEMKKKNRKDDRMNDEGRQKENKRKDDKHNDNNEELF